MRDLPRIQDGRPPYFVHLTHADQHEQTKVGACQVDRLNSRVESAVNLKLEQWNV